MKKVEIYELSAEELRTLISEVISEELSKQKPNPPETDKLISRKEAARHFMVSVVTIDTWRKKGILKTYRTGKRIYFKRSELDQTPDSINY